MTKVTIDRELLERAALLLKDSLQPPEGCADFDDWTAQGDKVSAELRAILAAPRQPEGDVPSILLPALRQYMHNDGSGLLAGYEYERTNQIVAELREECEQLRMQLAACGVVALANTPESAAQARQMHPDYMSASCSDVADAVDREMTLRQQLADSDAALRESRANDTAAMGHLADMRQQRDRLAELLSCARGCIDAMGWGELETDIDAALAEMNK